MSIGYCKPTRDHPTNDPMILHREGVGKNINLMRFTCYKKQQFFFLLHFKVYQNVIPFCFERVFFVLIPFESPSVF